MDVDQITRQTIKAIEIDSVRQGISHLIKDGKAIFTKGIKRERAWKGK